MANAVEDALNRASAEQRERAMATIGEARRNILNADIQMAYSPSGDAATIKARNEQIIEEAQRSIPAETMQSVDSVSPPMNTPPMHGMVNTEPIALNPEFKSTIESIEQGGGNNYLNPNAVDRAMARQAYEAPQQDPQEQAMSR
ncbi:hypothetical protein [Mucilaginibacter paludis]|uniref:Uncharacterized protein n=1 Tax=Mucilaginibacter paludis DSM 18603 TaxID=714943 RepID=H1Y3J0_9SPHI|nr:hypothetical protein [Mucilaginibacter paludis]EHQ29758.1 hypothetical protein Mucpa_5689 [Mucilaginibacter paludis DSM 18603]